MSEPFSSPKAATRAACAIMAVYTHSVGDYTAPNDGFCDRCPASKDPTAWRFQNVGASHRYVLEAVVESLMRDGVKVDSAAYKHALRLCNGEEWGDED